MLRIGAVLGIAVMACSRPSIAISDLDREMEQAQCEHLVRCKLFPDEAACHAFMPAASDPSVPAAVAAHKIAYDGERARECLDFIANQSCDVTSHDAHTPPPACGEMLSGRVADTEECSIDAECGSSSCVRTMECPEASCCPGRCAATEVPGAAGEPCRTARGCQAGLVCGADLTCQAPAGAGQACRGDRECMDGLACVGVTDLPGMCNALPGAGARCPYGRCADENLRCDADTSTCVAVGLPGDPCMAPSDCSIYLECDATRHQCREFPTLGMPCDGSCIDGSFCMLDDTGLTGSCVALLPDNTPCDGNQQCASGFCPDGPVFRGCLDRPACF